MVEGLAAVIVIWRLTGSRTVSPATSDAAGPEDSHRHGGEAGHSHLPGADADRRYLLVALVLLAA